MALPVLLCTAIDRTLGFDELGAAVRAHEVRHDGLPSGYRVSHSTNPRTASKTVHTTMAR